MNGWMNYKGRLNRRPYFFRSLALGIPELLLVQLPKIYHWQVSLPVELIGALVLLALAIVSFIQVIARLHDTDHSGWFTLLLFVPILGILFNFALLFIKGTTGPNRFGPDPLATAEPLAGSIQPA